VIGAGDTTVEKKLNIGENMPFGLNDNWTLSLDFAKIFQTSPKHHVVALESGVFSVSSALNFKAEYLTLALAPTRLHKHSAVYDLRLIVADQRVAAPLFWSVARVEYETWGEFVKTFADTEWDFEPPPKTPSPLLTKVFTGLMFVPFAVLVVMLVANGINFGYFPRAPLDVLVSITFVAGLGAFFVHFWLHVTFEQMCVYVLVFVATLGPLLRGALKRGSKMVARDARSNTH
jgi:hypothetical protein